MQGSANLNIMIKAVRKAGRSLIKDFYEVENLQASKKGADDFVARARASAEGILHEDLVGGRPNYGWLTPSSEVAGTDPTRRWIVDTLGGSVNYLHGLPHWALSIALEHKGEIVSALIYDAVRDELFFAEKGQGAWLNEGRLRVSGRHKIVDAVFSTGLPSGTGGGLPAALQDLARIMPACSGVRQSGVPALDLAYVSAGRSDGFWERKLKPWDIAAGILITREAGGFVESIDAGNNPIETGSLIAANSDIFENFAKIVRNI